MVSVGFVIVWSTLISLEFKREFKELAQDVPQENEENVELPTGVPIYPGARGESVSKVLQTYRFSTPDTPANVMNFYVNYFRNTNGNYQITPEETAPREGSNITADVIHKITITNPTDPDYKYIGAVSAYREGDKTIFTLQFPVDVE